MADPDPPIELITMSAPAERIFPTLTSEQIERAAAHGHVRSVHDHEVLVEAGAKNTRFFIVRTGRLVIVRPPGTDEHRVASVGPGQFTGETLTCDRKPYTIEMNDGSRVPARSIMIASGAQYRRLSIGN